MKDDTTHDGFSDPGGDFFDRQLDSIRARTVDLENWHLPGTRDVSACFPVPEGYWLRQEEAIRSRIRKPVSPAFVPIPALKWSLAVLALLMVTVLGFWQFPTDAPSALRVSPEDLSREEMLAFIADSDPELVRAEAARTLSPGDLKALSPVSGLKEKDAGSAERYLQESLPDLDYDILSPEEI